MIKRVFVWICLLLGFTEANCQEVTKKPENDWQINPNLSFYFIPHDFFILPTLLIDKQHLHLEARYNYEDRETFSLWMGYNFSGGKKLTYAITPMAGGVVGNSNGVAPGLRFELAFRRFTLSSESEYFFDLDETENNFYYNWSDLSYSIKDWLWAGASVQRSRAYQSDLDVQYGLLIGAGHKQWELNSYLYNLGTPDTFIMVTVSATF
jgi:hypothetical protein